MLRFSLILCTRGRPHLLRRALQATAQLRSAWFELIVVCDPDEPGTLECLRLHASGAKIGHCRQANLAQARNIGLGLAQGEIAAFLDDDAVPEPDWLQRLAAAYADPAVTAAGGFIRARDGVRFQSRFVLIDSFGGARYAAHAPTHLQDGQFLSLTGANFSVRREAAIGIGGFDENYPYFLEETDFLHRLLRAGGHIQLVPEAETHHGYAASGLRDAHGAPKSLAVIGRSKAYYCHINNPDAPPALIAAALRRFAARTRRQLLPHFFLSHLKLREVAWLHAELRENLRAGQVLAGAGRKLADFSGLPAAPFAAFAAAAKPAICVLADSPAQSCPQIRALAQEHAVTVIRRAGLRHRVTFTDGIWLHELPVFQGTRAMAAEIRRVSAARGFTALFVAPDSPRLAAGLPCFSLPGPAPAPR